MNDKDSYMQFNKSHISLITTFEHKKREESKCFLCSFQAWSITGFCHQFGFSVCWQTQIFGLLSIFFCRDLRSGWVRAGIVLLVPGCVALVLEEVLGVPQIGSVVGIGGESGVVSVWLQLPQLLLGISIH